MSLMVVSIPLLPVIMMLSSRYRVKITALCHQALAWVLRLVRGRVCVRSTHAFVFSQCTHGNADSVVETFDLYGTTQPSLCIGPKIGQYIKLQEIVLESVFSRIYLKFNLASFSCSTSQIIY